MMTKKVALASLVVGITHNQRLGFRSCQELQEIGHDSIYQLGSTGLSPWDRKDDRNVGRSCSKFWCLFNRFESLPL